MLLGPGAFFIYHPRHFKVLDCFFGQISLLLPAQKQGKDGTFLPVISSQFYACALTRTKRKSYHYIYWENCFQ
jgi:hypothetical protein